MSKDPAQRYLAPKKRYITNPRVFFAIKRVELFQRLLKHLRRGREIRRHFGVSEAIYQTYSDWEMRVYEHGSTWTLDHDRMAQVSFKVIRDYYLAPVISEIERIAAMHPERPVEVLEVGCGNGTNLMALRQTLGDRVCLRGIDISSERLRHGQDYWGERLAGVDMSVDSATELSTQADGSADVVFTIHCLEQIPYAVDACLSAIARVTRDRAVFVEPVWEFANPVQRMYTLFGDQLRTLLPSLETSDLEVVKASRAEIMANPLNQSGIVIAKRRGAPE